MTKPNIYLIGAYLANSEDFLRCSLEEIHEGKAGLSVYLDRLNFNESGPLSGTIESLIVKLYFGNEAAKPKLSPALQLDKLGKPLYLIVLFADEANQLDGFALSEIEFVYGASELQTATGFVEFQNVQFKANGIINLGKTSDGLEDLIL